MQPVELYMQPVRVAANLSRRLREDLTETRLGRLFTTIENALCLPSLPAATPVSERTPDRLPVLAITRPIAHWVRLAWNRELSVPVLPATGTDNQR